MSCITKEDLINSLKNHKALFRFSDSDTVDKILERLDFIQENFIKDDTGYKIVGTDIGVSKTVTQQAAKAQKGKPFTPTKEQENLYNQQAEIGNFVHDVWEEMMKEILDQLEGKSTKAALNYLRTISLDSLTLEGLKKIETLYGRSINRKDTSLENSLQGVAHILTEVYRQQNRINNKNKIDAVPKFRLEQKVIDARRDIGGTIDFMAILSDKSIIIRDYKSKIPSEKKLDEFGNIISMKKLISRRDLNRYKIQIGEYGNILQHSYGASAIRSSGIIPVKLSVPVNKGEFSKVVSGIKFPGQDPLLEQVRPFAEKTGFINLDEFILNIQSRISKLESKVQETKDREEKERLINRIEGLEAGKKDILINHSLNKIVEYAKGLNNQLRDAELNNLSIDELMDLRNEIAMLETLSKSTYEYRNYLKSEVKGGKEMAEKMEAEINVIVSELNDRYEDLTEILHEQAIQLIQQSTGLNITNDSGEVLPFHTEGFFGNYFYQLSKYDNPIFKTLRQLLDEANFNKRQRLEEIFTEVQTKENAVFNWLKSQGKTRQDLIKIMINPTTDNFWSKYSQEYTSKLFNSKSEDLHNFYTIKEEYQDWFNKELAKREDRIRQTPEITEKEVKEQLEVFRVFNDLTIENNKAKYPKAWENRKLKQFLEIKDGDFRNEYQYIQSVPELKEYYDMFEKYNKEFRDVLGVEYKNLPNNFLPNIRKQYSERVDEFGAIGGTLSGVQDFFKDFMNVREDDKDLSGEYDNRKSIPKFYLNEFRDADGKVIVGEKSYQFGRSLMLFANMALNYHEMSQIESNVIMLKEFLSERGEEIITKSGKPQKDSLGNFLTRNIKDTKTPELFDSFVDMYLYGINVKPELLEKDGRAEKALLKAKEYFSLKALGFNFIAATGSFVSAKIQAAIQGNKGVLYTSQDYKQSLKDMAFNRSKLLAINAFFDPMGHRVRDPQLAESHYGAIDFGDMAMRGWVNQYVNTRSLMRPFSIGDEYIDEIITASMAKNFYIDYDGNFRRFKSEEDRTKYKDRSIWNLFEYKDGVPKLNVSQEHLRNAYIGFRRAVQRGQGQIKGTIPEEDKAYWQSTLVGNLMMQFKSWMPAILFERFGKIKFDSAIDSVYMGRYKALGVELGEWKVSDLVRKEFLTKILLPKLAQFGKQLAFFGKMNDVHTKQLLFEQWIEENPQYRDKVTFEEFNDIQQRQLKTLMIELRILLAFAGIMMLMAGDWDDDGQADYKKYLLTRKLAATIFKTNQEMSFVFNPIDFTNMVKTPLPMIGLVTDSWKLMKNTIDELLDIPFGEERLIGGQKKDKTAIGYYGHTFIPGGRLLDFFDLWKDDSGEQYK